MFVQHARCMSTRKVTLSLPTEPIRQVNHAAQHDTTVHAFDRGLLQDALSREGRTREAVDGLPALAEQGLSFDADPRSFRRNDIYVRSWFLGHEHPAYRYCEADRTKQAYRLSVLSFPDVS